MNNNIPVGRNFNSDDVASFQSGVTESFYTKLKEHIQKSFISVDAVSCFSTFDLKRFQILQKTVMYEEHQVKVLLEHHAFELPDETFAGDEFVMPTVITSRSNPSTEWKTFWQYITNQPSEVIKEQLSCPLIP